MKKTLFLFIALLSITFVKAQESGIIYRDFEPDLCVAAESWEDSNDTIKLDIDQDGTIDFMMIVKYGPYSTMERYTYISSTWSFRFRNNILWDPTILYDENDTIVPYSLWGDPGRWELLWWNNPLEYLVGFKKTINNENYYAWARIYIIKNPNGPGYHPSHGQFDIIMAYCDNVAYCTIPDYPLRWGQTSTAWDVEENNMPSFADIQPNPTNGAIAITGKDLKKAEVFNSQGQQVRSAQCQGDQLTFDLGNLPAGLYFVSVTDTNGKRCVKKVVKQ